MKRDFKFALFAVLALTTLAGCSSADKGDADPKPEARQFSEEDKRVARALSVSQVQSISDAEGPYARALLCANGMDALAERFQDFRGLGEQQRSAIEQAREYFGQQLREAGASEGKSANDIESDLQKTAQDNIDPAENARTAMACLQRLQQAG